MDINPITLRSSWWLRLHGHHPLVRQSDRIEAIAVALLVLMAILIVPFACAVGTSVHDSSAEDYTRRSASQHQLEVTVTGESDRMPEPYQVRTRTPVRWVVDGITHDDLVTSEQSLKPGDTLTIWVDDHGNRVRSLATAWEPVIDAVCAALWTWALTVGLGIGVLTLLRRQLLKNRSAMWERELNDLASDGGSRSDSW